MHIFGVTQSVLKTNYRSDKIKIDLFV